MPTYDKKSVWTVIVDGEVNVEAATQQAALVAAKTLLIAGEGSLALTATLRQDYIEKPPTP